MLRWWKHRREAREWENWAEQIERRLAHMAQLPFKVDAPAEDRFWLWSQPLLTYTARHHKNVFNRVGVPGLLAAMAVAAENMKLLSREEATRAAKAAVTRLVDDMLRDG